MLRQIKSQFCSKRERFVCSCSIFNTKLRRCHSEKCWLQFNIFTFENTKFVVFFFFFILFFLAFCSLAMFIFIDSIFNILLFLEFLLLSIRCVFFSFRIYCCTFSACFTRFKFAVLNLVGRRDTHSTHKAIIKNQKR